MARCVTNGLPAHVIDALVDGNAVKPTVELRRTLETGEFLIRFEKNLLREVERVVWVGNNREDNAVNAVAVTAVEVVEYTGIPRLKAGY